ncbi:F-box domain-containing protein [Mycena indigotica]|uniref:F-box domain-containing protein n=1 Tax=Mycena indigotica TaxID=2126181 RepID=A0A8H6W2Z2_9AGAR|nr:F-box domain-containing protein [Mycena indigotica]KAF7297444.1 F-box domain-containing protein [Mycena indigotica]
MDPKIAVLESKNDYFAQLPNEILDKLFSFVPGLPNDGWMYVCRRWYELSKDPQRWASITLKKWRPKRLLGALERAGQQPLNVVIDRLGSNAEETIKTMLGQAARLVSLNICGDASEIDQVVALIVKVTAFPVLVSLALAKEEDLDIGNEAFYEYADQVPPLPLARMPKLSSLSLIGVRIDYKAPLPSLTLLRLSWSRALYRLGRTLRLLQKSPKLEALILEDGRVDDPHPVDTDESEDEEILASDRTLKEVQLPMLKRFKLRHWSSNMGVVLKHLTLPSHTRMSFDADQFDTEVLWNGFTSILQRQSQISSLPMPQACLLRIEGHFSTRSSPQYLTIDTYAQDSLDTPAHFSLRFGEEPEPSENAAATKNFLRAIAPAHLSKLKHLYVAGELLSKATWQALFADGIIPLASSVEHITIRVDDSHACELFIQSIQVAPPLRIVTVIVEEYSFYSKERIPDPLKQLAKAYFKAQGVKLPLLQVRWEAEAIEAAPGARESEEMKKWEDLRGVG